MSTTPALFLSHGPGPLWMLDKQEMSPHFMSKNIDNSSPEATFLKNMTTSQRLAKPKALLVISAHFDEKGHTVTTNPHPPMYYDYGGFPSQAYKVCTHGKYKC